MQSTRCPTTPQTSQPGIADAEQHAGNGLADIANYASADPESEASRGALLPRKRPREAEAGQAVPREDARREQIAARCIERGEAAAELHTSEDAVTQGLATCHL